MGKKLFIAEKPSVAQEFAKALDIKAAKRDGYIESDEYIVTWCVGHLVTMSYPEIYDKRLKKWELDTLPFIPTTYKYEIIENVKKQFGIVSGLLNRKDVDVIYVCTDSGREGEYIYRLVDMMAKVPDSKDKRRVWIDSQTKEEILRGIREAKPLKEYDALAASAFMRAQEDYLMGINFSRLLTLKYGNIVNNFLGVDFKNGGAISVGRVMTCVLGMVVDRERSIRDFVKTPFYRLLADIEGEGFSLKPEWRVREDSEFFNSPMLYKENGFRQKEDALALRDKLLADEKNRIRTETGEEAGGKDAGGMEAGGKDAGGMEATLCLEVVSIEKKNEKRQPPTLFNLAELQNVCSKMFKISPDETLGIAQKLYERKLVTYPRTDARVLSSAVCKEIEKNIKGLAAYDYSKAWAVEVLSQDAYKKIASTKYCNDKQITDHYAIIPTGQGISGLGGLSKVEVAVYQLIIRRFLSIFYPPAVYLKISAEFMLYNGEKNREHFFQGLKLLKEEGYMKVSGIPKADKETGAGENNVKKNGKSTEGNGGTDSGMDGEEQEIGADCAALLKFLSGLKKGMKVPLGDIEIKEGETVPPKRYTSGTLILAMENAGQLIEDEELRAQIKSSGIGTSATRAEILNKLVKIGYLNLNKKTQVIMPSKKGELIYEVVRLSIASLLNPKLTASWEKGLTYVSEGQITDTEYTVKLNDYVRRITQAVKNANYSDVLLNNFRMVEKAVSSYKAGTGV